MTEKIAKIATRKKVRLYDRCRGCGTSGPTVELAFVLTRGEQKVLRCSNCRKGGS